MLARNTGEFKLNALNMLLRMYHSQKCLEKAVRAKTKTIWIDNTRVTNTNFNKICRSFMWSDLLNLGFYNHKDFIDDLVQKLKVDDIFFLF